MEAAHNIIDQKRDNPTKATNNSKKKLRKQRETAWNFLKKNSPLMKTTESRKKHKVFKALSKIVGTRSSVQAKSHHQKLQQKYHSIYNIIFNIGNIIKHRKMEQQTSIKFQSMECLRQPDAPQQNEKIQERLPQRFQDFIFESDSQNYDPISACINFDLNEPLI